MLDVKQFRSLVVDPALKAVDMYSEAASRLLVGTALVESNLTYLKQIKGPALGLFQMEPATYHDHVTWLLASPSRRHIAELLNPLRPEKLIWDLQFAAILCRVHYLRVPAPLPAADDIDGLAQYWKDHYNTRRGKGRPEEFVRRYREFGGGH